MEGQRRAAAGPAGGRGRDPSIPECSGGLAALAELGSTQAPAPAAPAAPHLTLPEPPFPPQPEPPQPLSEPFSAQLPQPPRKASADSAASQAQTSLPVGRLCGLAGADGLPEAAGRGLGASCEVPARRAGARVWLFHPGMWRELWTPRASAPESGAGPPRTLAGPPKPRQPRTCSVVSAPSRGLRARPTSRRRLPDSRSPPRAAPRLVCGRKTERNRPDNTY